MEARLAVAVVVAMGLFELAGLGCFLVGYFGGVTWLMIVGGLMVVLDDAVQIMWGILKPQFPVVLAVALAILVRPWYVGVFWASAAFKILGIPRNLVMIFAPHRFVGMMQGTARGGRPGWPRGL